MDNQGTVRDVIDSQGNVLNHISYDSFGQVTNQTNPTAFFRFGYTGREFDQESGQYFYRARYFDPGVGRFISEDPIGFDAGDTNVYRYVFNSPLNYTDPSGNIPLFVVGVLGLGGLILPILLEDAIVPEPAFAPGFDFCGESQADKDARARKRALVGLGLGLGPGIAKSALRGAGRYADDVVIGVGRLGRRSRFAPELVPVGPAFGGSADNVVSGTLGDITQSTAGRATLGRGLDEAIGRPLRSQGQNNTPQVQQNAAKGKAFQQKAKKDFELTNTGVQEEVTIKTQSGTRTRVDMIGRDINTGDVAIGEAKSSQTAPLTKNQKKAFPEIGQTGGVVVGKGKPGFPGGTKIPPTQVQIMRP